MNLCIHTGYLREHANRYQNAAGEALLFFTLLVRDERRGEDVAHKMRVERYDLIKSYEPLLTPGRSMTVHSRSKLVPIVRHGLVKAETIAFEVDRIEFHSRAGARDVPAEAQQAEAVAEAVAPEADASADDAPLKRVLDQFSDSVKGSVGDADKGADERRRAEEAGSQSPPAAKRVA
jgi:hypothetical protein